MRYVLVILVVLVGVSFVFAQAEHSPTDNPSSGHADPVASVLIAMTVILLAAKVGGELFQYLRQPSVLGELVFGMILGNLVLINPEWNFFEPLRASAITADWAIVIDRLARIGVILLLFEVGLESTIHEMRKVGLSSTLVAVVGVVAPFVLGYGVSALFITVVPQEILAMSPNFSLSNIHLFIGATLCATSVGITARVFRDLNKMHLPEAKIVLGAAVIDDVLGLIILAIVSGIVVAAETGTALSIGSLVQITAIALGFLFGAIAVGIFLVPKTLKLITRMRSEGMMLISAILFCFIMAYLANLAGLAAIVGAFAAGLILEPVHFQGFREERQIEELLQPVTTLLVPIFFVVMGIQVRLESFLNFTVVEVALGLTVVAFIGKQVCGLVVREKGFDRLSVGLGMVPRGEVGLIFASIGKELKVVDDAIFSSVVIMVILTTMMTPPLLKFSLERFEKKQAKKHVTN